MFKITMNSHFDIHEFRIDIQLLFFGFVCRLITAVGALLEFHSNTNKEDVFSTEEIVAWGKNIISPYYHKWG